jgi:hypothetical protein
LLEKVIENSETVGSTPNGVELPSHPGINLKGN